MTDEQKPVDPLEPIQKVSFACSVCGILKSEAGDARHCAVDDTRKITVSNVDRTDPAGYPTAFTGVFRTDFKMQYAEVIKCTKCPGTGEIEKNAALYPCDACNGTGLVVKK